MTDTDADLLEELASLPTFHHPSASPDGDEVALYYDVTGRNELHVVDVETGDVRQLSDGEVPRNARWWVDWSADGDRIFFHDDEGGDEQNDVYAIDRDGEVEPVVELGGETVLHDVGDDGETLLVGSPESGQMNLYRHDLATGETDQLTDNDRAVGGGTLSPDCDRLAYVTNESKEFANMDVYVADVDGGNVRNLDIGKTGAEAGVADWGPDGERLLVSDNTENFTKCGIYDLESDDVTWYGDLDVEEEAVAVLPDGERFLATRTRRAAIVPVVYDVTRGERRELDLPEGVTTFSPMGDSVLGDDRVLLVHTTPDRRSELLAYDSRPTTGRPCWRLSTVISNRIGSPTPSTSPSSPTTGWRSARSCTTPVNGPRRSWSTPTADRATPTPARGISTRSSSSPGGTAS